MFDWGDGKYENTASTLEEAARAALGALGSVSGHRLLDLGCGTGNVSLLAARQGAVVVAIDPSERLVEVTSSRARAAELVVEAKVGDAGAIPARDGELDDVVSVFAVIFAADAELAAREMVRVTKPGGRIVVTAWLPRGPMAEAGMILRRAATPPAAPPAPPPPWGDASAVRDLFARHGADAAIEERTIHFEASSAEAWFAEQEAHHPVWRGVRRLIDPSAWAAVRDSSVEVLRAGNLAKNGFRVASDYLLVVATKRT